MDNTFGANTDFFGLADANWELQSSNYNPESSQAQAEDEYGDIDCEERYENTASVECVYKLKSNGTLGKVDLPADFQGGHSNEEGGDTFVITGGTLACSNTERPTLTVSGVEMHGATDALAIYDFAGEIGEINARKVATEIGFSVSLNTKVNTVSVACSCETARMLDSDGEIAMVDVYRGRLESSGDLVTCEGAQTVAAAEGWTLQNNPSKTEENVDFLKGSVSVFKNLSAVEES